MDDNENDDRSPLDAAHRIIAGAEWDQEVAGRAKPIYELWLKEYKERNGCAMPDESRHILQRNAAAEGEVRMMIHSLLCGAIGSHTAAHDCSDTDIVVDAMLALVGIGMERIELLNEGVVGGLE
jgi:hypothetical protein